MYLQFALVAVLALTGFLGSAPPREGSLGSLSSSLELQGAGAPSSEFASDTATPDGVAVEQIDIIVPPVALALPSTPSEAQPEPQAAADEVVADQRVSAERVESEVVEASGFQTIGVTWPEGAQVESLGGQFRTRTDGAWSEWIDLEPGDDGPDAGTADATNAARGGTDPVSIGDVDAVQLAFAATPEGGPDGLSLALVGSAESPAPDRVVGTAASGSATVRSASLAPGVLKTATAPRVISRAEWGAPAQVCTPDVASKLVAAVVHHTAGSNSYSSVAEAMQQIRNDAAYHISGRGWCDIGYNFIVDKWGNIYEGRANSFNQAVIGVHAGGFNTGTVGVSILGTYDAVPSAATQQAVGQIIGWRLGSYGLNPLETMNYYTAGGENSRFTNQNVSIQRVFGHRDTAFTACPGNGGYAALPNIREFAAQTARNVNAAPVGAVDAITTTATSLTVSGWAFDPDTTQPNEVHVYVDGVGVALRADGSRPDVGAVFGNGDRHGFTHTRTLAAGNHSMCIYSIDTAGGPNTTLDCRAVTVGSIVPLTAPLGMLDSAIVSSVGIALSGWTLDPDTTTPTNVHIYIDGVATVMRADQPRPDIAAVFGKGERHGFARQVALRAGEHDVCVYAINTGPGANTLLGCRSFVVIDALPFGAVDTVRATNAGIAVTGWALDPDTSASTQVHVYIDGVGVGFVADQSRPDVAAAFGHGDRHGFNRLFTATPGSHDICVFAINTSVGANVTLTCRTVVVPDAAPIGVLDAVLATPGTLVFAGWTLDPDTNASNQVHVYIDGLGVALAADQSRPDIAVAFGRGDRHGFSYTAHVAAGLRSICVYGINTVQGPNTMLGCRTVIVP